MSDPPMESPVSSLPNRTATDSLVSVPLSDSVRFSVTYHESEDNDATPVSNQDEADEEVETHNAT